MKFKIAAYPQLRLIAWSRDPETEIDGADALSLYEANWRHVDPTAFSTAEQALLDTLVARYGNGVLNV